MLHLANSVPALGDTVLPTFGYLLSLWAALAVLTVIGVVNLILLVQVKRHQREDRQAHAADWAQRTYVPPQVVPPAREHRPSTPGAGQRGPTNG